MPPAKRRAKGLALRFVRQRFAQQLHRGVLWRGRPKRVLPAFQQAVSIRHCDF